MINWKLRVKQPMFWIALAGAILSPILTYFGINAEDVTSWSKLGSMLLEMLHNPYLCFIVATEILAFLGISMDMTTKGWSDSKQAMGYENPKED